MIVGIFTVEDFIFGTYRIADGNVDLYSSCPVKQYSQTSLRRISRDHQNSFVLTVNKDEIGKSKRCLKNNTGKK